MRRLRQFPWSRELVCEHRLTPADLIWPLFVLPGSSKSDPVQSLPGVSRFSVDLLLDQVAAAVDLGIPAIALSRDAFELKTEDGREALNEKNLICTATRAVREQFGDKIGVVCDVALDPYTSHGQDGLLRDGQIVNDPTIEVLCKQSVVQAAAGAVCDCTVRHDGWPHRRDPRGARCSRLSERDDHVVCRQVCVAFYGPFRDAVGSKGNLGSGDKKTYQMQPSATDEAMHEVALDLQEGADIVMVKPGMPYLDIVRL